MLFKIYKELLKEYGPQGWWPKIDSNDINPNKTGSINGYQPMNYSFPETQFHQFEICVGAILTQNTNWINVDKSLRNLMKNNLLDPHNILKCNLDLLKEAIRPSGYYNQKTNYLRNFTEFYLKLQSNDKDFSVIIPTRKEVKSIKGIGDETADCIMLYAFGQPEFVIDAYTKRIFSLFGFFNEKTKYQDVKKIFTENILKQNLSQSELVIVYQEYHALIVEHAKRHYNKKPYKRDAIIKKILS